MLSDKIRKKISPYSYNGKYHNNASLNFLLQAIENNKIHTLCLDSTFDYIKDRVKYIIDSNVDGNIFLAGVWKGGLAAYIQALLIENGQHDKRKLILADTYSGFTETTSEKEKKFLEIFENISSPSLNDVKLLFEEFALPLDNVIFLKGDIAKTSINFQKKISILILDMDFYEPTYNAFINLYDNVDENGVIYIDDYYCENFDCKKATDDFIATKKINKLVRINQFGASIFKKQIDYKDFSYQLYEKIFCKNLENFCTIINELYLNNPKSQPINCIGVDYDSNNTPKGIKFYFGYFDKLGDFSSKLGDFIPRTDLLNQLLSIRIKDPNNKNPFQNDSLSFSIKWNLGDQAPRFGFHIRMKNFVDTEFWKLPKLITISQIDLENYQGIGVEFIDGKACLKNYYYISDEITKKQLAKIFNDERIRKAKIVEYTESELGVKIILWYNLLKSEELINSNINCFADNFLLNEIELKESFHGFYLNKTKLSKYYVSDVSLMKIDTYEKIIKFYNNL